MQKIAATLPLSREKNVSSMLQLPLKKQSHNMNPKEEKPRQPPKRKKNTNNIISYQLFLAL
jgi:hypothetical protein